MTDLSNLLQLGIGSIMAFIGLASVAIGIARWRAQERTPLWFGLFATLYGVRLLVSLEAFSRGIGLREVSANFVSAGITYGILAPACLLTASLFNRQSTWLRRLWQLDLVYAVAATCADLARGSPGSMLWLNAPAVTVNFATLIVNVVSGVRGSRWTAGLAAALAGLTLFLILAGGETYTSVSNPRGSRTSLEPIGMLALVWGLGLLVAERGMASERRLIAISHELATARTIQRSILPTGVPCVPGVAVGARLVPMTEVAGDFYDFLVADDAVGVFVADVSGHGVPAAIVASMVKIALASEAESLRDPGLVLTRMNRALSGKFDIAFITAVYACVDVRGRKLIYASAGHPAPLLRRASGQVQWLGERELVLCVRAEVRYPSIEVPLTSGDCVVFYTDGVTEAVGPGGEHLGDERLAKIVGGAGGGEPAGFVDALLGEVRMWRGREDPDFTDDITVVTVRFDGDVPAA